MVRTSAIEAVFTTRPPSIYASPNFSAGSRRTPRWAARVMKRIAAGVPVPSPRVKVDPPAVVTRRFPVRTNLPNISRSNQSIGRFLHARPSPPYAAGFRHGVGRERSARQPCPLDRALAFLDPTYPEPGELSGATRRSITRG